MFRCLRCGALFVSVVEGAACGLMACVRCGVVAALRVATARHPQPYVVCGHPVKAIHSVYVSMD